MSSPEIAEVKLPQPTIADPNSAPRLRWGILAPGGIAETFARSLAGTPQEIVAVGSRSHERAAQFARKWGGTAYGSYEALCAAADVDIVYVASPHSEHRDHALMAIQAGKHVLVEKAFTRNVAEAREVFAAAEKAGVFVMEAMWSRFLPHYDVVRQSVAQGILGDLKFVQADHGQPLYPDGPARLAEPSLAGGALLDLGIYPVSFAAMLLPQIESVAATGVLTEQGVDESVAITLRGPRGEMAVGTTTMAAATPNTAVVAGSRARLEIDGWFYFPNTVRLVSSDGELLDTFSPQGASSGSQGSPDVAVAQDGAGAHSSGTSQAPTDHDLRYEAAEAARCIDRGLTESPLLPWAETLRVMTIVDEARAQVGVTFPGE